MPKIFEFRKGKAAGVKQGDLLADFPCTINPRDANDTLNQRLCRQCTAFNGDRRTIKVLLESDDGWIVEKKSSDEGGRKKDAKKGRKKKGNKKGKKQQSHIMALVEVKEYNSVIYRRFKNDYILSPGVTAERLRNTIQRNVIVHLLNDDDDDSDMGDPQYERVVVEQEETNEKRRLRCRNNACLDNTYCKKHLSYVQNIDTRQSDLLTSKGIEGRGLFVDYPAPMKYINRLRLYGLDRYLRARKYIIKNINMSEWLAHGEYYAKLGIARSVWDIYEMDEARQMVFTEQMTRRPQRPDPTTPYATPPRGPKTPLWRDLAVFTDQENIILYDGEFLTQEQVDKRYDYKDTRRRRVQPTAPFTMGSVDAACWRNSASAANAFGPGPVKSNGAPVFTNKLSTKDKPNDPETVLGGHLYNNGFNTKDAPDKPGFKYIALMGKSAQRTDGDRAWNGEEILIDYGLSDQHSGPQSDDYWQGSSDYYGSWSERLK